MKGERSRVFRSGSKTRWDKDGEEKDKGSVGLTSS